MTDDDEKFFDDLVEDNALMLVGCDIQTREAYVRDWWANHRQNKSEMRQIISNLIFKHCGHDDFKYSELMYNFDRMFETGPEPEGIDPSYKADGEDNHFHHAIGNKILVAENFWGEGSLYRIHKMYPMGSPCLNMLFEVEDEDG